MAAGDIFVYGPTTPDKLAALLATKIVVADDVTMCSMSSSQVVVLVVKAA